jgi:hypothetical protein
LQNRTLLIAAVLSALLGAAFAGAVDLMLFERLRSTSG